jgi:flagellar FliJ protein
MKRFKFPLRPVAIIRANIELRAREALAAALNAAAAAEQRLALSRTRARELEEVIFDGRRVRFRACDEAAFFQEYRRLCAAVMEFERQVIAAQAEVRKRRDACVEANRQVKVVARLEEKARASHRAAWRRAEQLEIDEIAGFRAFSQREAL